MAEGYHLFRGLGQKLKKKRSVPDKRTMIKLILVLTLVSVSSPIMADACWSLYQNKAQEIQKEEGYDTYVGGQFYVVYDQINYWPGMKVSARIDNWSQEFMDSIKWGPYSFSLSSKDPRKEWLEAFKKSIKNECPLPAEKDYDSLRAMLKELMDDGSFCPRNKILEPKFLGGKKGFKKVLAEAVKDQRFLQYCRSEAITDDSHREISNKEGRSPSVIERTPLRSTQQ